MATLNEALGEAREVRRREAAERDAAHAQLAAAQVPAFCSLSSGLLQIASGVGWSEQSLILSTPDELTAIMVLRSSWHWSNLLTLL